jgi:FkbM family methyltransferase
VIEFGRARGYEVTPLWRLEARPLILHLRELFKLYSVDCVFDVGGNLGQYHDLIRDEVGFAGPILSFEPVRQYVNHLRQRASADDRWQVFDFALGSDNATTTINVTKSPGLNSLLEPRRDVVEGFWRDDSVAGVETISVRRLDDLFPVLEREHGFRAPYLKLDTQGFDLEVLRGAAGCLPRFAAMQTEISVRPIYVGAPTPRDVEACLSAAGSILAGSFQLSTIGRCG